MTAPAALPGNGTTLWISAVRDRHPQQSRRASAQKRTRAPSGLAARPVLARVQPRGQGVRCSGHASTDDAVI
eukprot:8643842-Pyramimonas_sp.AAC.1